MYTRSYFPDEEKINIPENYDGNAFSGGYEGNLGSTNVQPSVAEAKVSPRDVPPFPEKEEKESVHEEEAAEVSARPYASFLSKIPLKSILPERLGSFLKLDKFKLGTEEILLAALALFLLFSKDGDKECAVILLLLIFIN